VCRCTVCTELVDVPNLVSVAHFDKFQAHSQEWQIKKVNPKELDFEVSESKMRIQTIFLDDSFFYSRKGIYKNLSVCAPLVCNY